MELEGLHHVASPSNHSPSTDIDPHRATALTHSASVSRATPLCFLPFSQHPRNKETLRFLPSFEYLPLHFEGPLNHRSLPPTTVNLDFDARVPVPFSLFPSSYRNDVAEEITRTRVEGEVTTERVGREGQETRHSSFSASLPGRGHQEQEEVRIYDEDRNRRPRRTEEIKVYEEHGKFPEVELARDR